MTIIEVPVTHTVDLRRQPAWMVERGLARAMAHCRPGDVVEAWSTDASARDAVAAWVSAAGHRLIGIEARDGYDEIFVEAGPGSSGSGWMARPGGDARHCRPPAAPRSLSSVSPAH